MNHVRVVNGVSIAYPYDLASLKVDFPATSFPVQFAGLELGEFGVFHVTGSSPAAHNPLTHKPVVSVALVQGVWKEVWSIVALSAEAAAAELAQMQGAILKSVVDLTEARLDAFANTRNYDTILSACSYAGSAVPKFDQEGQYAVAVRDQTWAVLYTILADVQGGVRGMPTRFEDIVEELPTLAWPE